MLVIRFDYSVLNSNIWFSFHGVESKRLWKAEKRKMWSVGVFSDEVESDAEV